jgi:hypothetical protein
MTRCTNVCRAAAFVVGLMLVALPVCAQTSRPARPYRSLFGSVDANRPSLHALDLTVSLNGAADNGMASSSSPEGSSRATFQQLYSAVAQLNYALRGRQFTGDLTGSSNLPYYPGSGDRLSALGYGANASLGYTSGATSTTTYGSYTYSPYYAMALDPATALGASAQPFDYASARNPNTQTSAGASMTRRFGRRTSTSLAYLFNESLFVNEHRSLRNQEARVSADRQLSRSLTLRGSYGYREARFETAAAPSIDRSQDLDVGVGYTRASPRGRATTIDLGLGSSVLRRGSFTQRRGWRGSARVSRTFGAGWTTGVGFNRSLQFNTVLQTPVWAEVANADVSGRFGPRVNLSLAASYSNGQRATLRDRGFEIYSGSLRAQIGVASFAALDMQYIYYKYDFAGGYELPVGVPPRMDRQRLQLGASFRLPLVRAGSAREARTTLNQ